MEERGFLEIHFWQVRGRMCGPCGWQTDPMKYTSNRLPNRSLENGEKRGHARIDMRRGMIWRSRSCSFPGGYCGESYRGYAGFFEAICGERNWRERMARSHTRTHRAIRGSYGRPAVDPFGSRASSCRVTFRDDHCSWLSDAVVDQSVYERRD